MSQNIYLLGNATSNIGEKLKYARPTGWDFQIYWWQVKNKILCDGASETADVHNRRPPTATSSYTLFLLRQAAEPSGLLQGQHKLQLFVSGKKRYNLSSLRDSPIAMVLPDTNNNLCYGRRPSRVSSHKTNMRPARPDVAGRAGRIAVQPWLCCVISHISFRSRYRCRCRVPKRLFRHSGHRLCRCGHRPVCGRHGCRLWPSHSRFRGCCRRCRRAR